MKENLPKLTDANTLVVFDTNVWLDLYGYAPKATQEICAALARIRNHMWVPSQVQIEYTSSRQRCRADTKCKYSTLHKKYSEPFIAKFQNLSKELKAIASNGFVDTGELVGQLDLQFEALMDSLKTGIQEIDTQYQTMITDYLEDETDPIYSVYLSIILEKPALSFSKEELYGIFGEGAIRYACGIGPGITDASKGRNPTPKNTDEQFAFEMRKYGDLIIWKELLRYVADKPINLVFVENERKPDWWGSCDIGTVPNELLKEYAAVSPQGSFSMIDLKRFLEAYQAELMLPAGEGLTLVKRLLFRDRIFDFLNQEGAAYLENAVSLMLDDEYAFYELIKDLPIRLGYIEGVTEYEIDSVNVESFTVEQDHISGLLYIEGQIALSCRAIVSCYISHDFSMSQEYELKIGFFASSHVDINYDDIDIDPQDAIEVFNCSVENEQLIGEEMISNDIIDVDY